MNSAILSSQNTDKDSADENVIHYIMLRFKKVLSQHAISEETNHHDVS